MNALTQRNRTLGELLAELRARLGFVTQGSAAAGNAALLTSFLQEAQDFVYHALESEALRQRSALMLQAGAARYDWHDDARDAPIDPGTVLGVWLLQEQGARALVQGIDEALRQQTDRRGAPQRFDALQGQIEFWPTPDQAYEVTVEHASGLTRLSLLDDRPCVPERLLLLYALATAKAHYRHPDAQAAAQAFEVMLGRERARQRMQRRYFAAAALAQEPLAQAQVVRTAAGYRLSPP